MSPPCYKKLGGVADVRKKNLDSCTNSYANSQVNFVHEIRTKFVIFDKLGKISYEFARIRECYVTNGLYCIVRQNSSVNVSGKVNHNVAFDEYMETFVVRPLKSYISGKTTIRVLKAISGSTQLINSLRNVNLSEYGYGVHRTNKHSTAESLPDQLKVARFCLENDFFNIDKSHKKVRTYPVEAFSVKEGFVPNDRVEVPIKGQSKVKENFARRMFELYPERREKCMV